MYGTRLGGSPTPLCDFWRHQLTGNRQPQAETDSTDWLSGKENLDLYASKLLACMYFKIVFPVGGWKLNIDRLVSDLMKHSLYDVYRKTSTPFPATHTTSTLYFQGCLFLNMLAQNWCQIWNQRLWIIRITRRYPAHRNLVALWYYSVVFRSIWIWLVLIESLCVQRTSKLCIYLRCWFNGL